MAVVWITETVTKVGTAVASSPAGQAALTNGEKWAIAGYVAITAGMAWFGSDDPPKPHEDVDLPASGAWHDPELIHCTMHPNWDCYTSGEGCLGRGI